MFTSWARKKNKVLATVLALGVGVGAASCSSGDDGDNGGDGATRTFVDSLGNSVEIPDKPERIVSLTATQGPYFVSLGAPLVGLGGLDQQFADDLSKYGDVSNIEGIPVDAAGYSVEKIAQLDPDVVTIAADLEGMIDNIDDIESIAPVVYLSTSWREGDVVPRDIVAPYIDLSGDDSGALDELQDRVDEKINAISAQLGGDPSAIRTSYVSLTETRELFYRYPGSSVWPYLLLLNDAGVTWAYDENYAEEPKSLETALDVESDLIIFQGSKEQLAKTSLLAEHPAVKAGNVIFVKDPGILDNQVTYDYYLQAADDLLSQVTALSKTIIKE